MIHVIMVRPFNITTDEVTKHILPTDPELDVEPLQELGGFGLQTESACFPEAER